MKNKQDIEFGGLYLINFDPSVGREYRGKRPAVIIEVNSQIKKTNLITVLPLTSNLNNKIIDDVLIRADGKNRLRSDSIIKVYNIISFDYSRFIKKIGIIDTRTMGRIKKYLKKHFDLWKWYLNSSKLRLGGFF